jgi:hypothetical protein
MSFLTRLSVWLRRLFRKNYLKALDNLPEEERKRHLDTHSAADAGLVLDRLQKSQGVDFLPGTYRQYMLAQGLARTQKGGVILAGSRKLGWMLQQGGLYENPTGVAPPVGVGVPTTRAQLMARLKDRLSYPEDLFVFCTDMWTTFYFFRTHPPADDPAVAGLPQDRVPVRAIAR